MMALALFKMYYVLLSSQRKTHHTQEYDSWVFRYCKCEIQVKEWQHNWMCTHTFNTLASKLKHNLMLVFFPVPVGVTVVCLNRHKWMEINVHKPCNKQLDTVIGLSSKKAHCSGQAANEYSTGNSPRFPKSFRRAFQGSGTKGLGPPIL